MDIPWGPVLSSAIVGAIAAAAVTHYFAARRDAVNDARARNREIEHEQRERARDEERVSRDREREHAAVSADLLARIRGHCEELRPWLIQANPQTSPWYAANQALLTRASDRVVSDALQAEYPRLIDAIRYEQKSVVVQQKLQDEALPKIFTPQGARLPNADDEEHHFRALSIENVADVIGRYAPLVAEYGDPNYAAELSRTAQQFRQHAHEMLRRPPYLS
jgi:hypothetical protein